MTRTEVPPPDRRPVTIVDRLCKMSAPYRIVRDTPNWGRTLRGDMPVNEHYVSTSKIGAAVAWGLTLALVASAWFAWLVLGQATLATLLCMTGGTASAVAAVLNIRCYAIRLGRLIRVTAGMSPGSTDLRSVN